MRIVTWNCNGALRRKLDQVDSLQADILVIQECEDPASSTVEYRAWARQYLWAGANRTKGIGIFLRNGGGLERLDWPDNGLKQFLPAKINGQLDILAVWTKRTRSSSFSYIGQFWNYLKLNRPDIHSNLLICGDFNSSTIWDKRGRVWNHSECVKELAELGFGSLYHLATREPQGLESCPTFFLQRNPSKPYHIDYAFAHLDRIPNGWSGVTVGKREHWLPHSDHMPVIIDI